MKSKLLKLIFALSIVSCCSIPALQAEKDDSEEEENTLREFELLLNKVSRRYYRKDKKGKKRFRVKEWSSSYRQEYENYLSQMLVYSRKVQKELISAGVKNINLPKYAMQLREAYFRRKKTVKNTALGDQNMWYPLSKLRNELVKAKESGIFKSTQSDKKKKTAEEKIEKIDPANYTTKGLREKLHEIRQEIMEENTSIDSIDKDTVKDFLTTLTDKEKERYKKLYKRYNDQDYVNNKDKAKAAAILDIYSNSRDKKYGNREQILKILKKMDRLKEEEDGKKKKKKKRN